MTDGCVTDGSGFGGFGYAWTDCVRFGRRVSGFCPSATPWTYFVRDGSNGRACPAGPDQ